MVQQDRLKIDSPKSSALWKLVFFLCAGLLAFVRIHIPLQEPQESRYAEIPRQMLVEGSWLVPVLHGEPYLDKPPLLYWLVMGCYSLFGVHDWTARLVPCLATFLTIGVTFCWGRRALGSRGGFLAGMILALSVRFIYLSRMVTMDTLLCLWVVAALAGAHLAISGERFRWRLWLASAVACGLGLLTKGPVALLLIMVPVGLFSFLIPKCRRPLLRAWLAYLGLALGVALPWYLAVMASDSEFIEYFFWKHNVERFVTPFDHQEPVWFYAPEILVGMLPWTLLLPGLIWSSIRRRDPSTVPPGDSVYFIIAVSWCVLFFSVAGCKRPGYVLPAMPMLALALGSYLNRILPPGSSVDSLLRYHSRLACGATTMVLVVASSSCFLAAEQRLLTPPVGFTLGSCSLSALLIFAWRCYGRRAGASWLQCGAATFSMLLLGLYFLLPGYARRFSMRGQVRPLAVTCRDASLKVACYPRGWDSVNFYLLREDVQVYTTERRHELFTELTAARGTLLFVRTERALEDLKRELPDSLEYVPQGRQGTVRVGLVQPRGGGLVAHGKTSAP